MTEFETTQDYTEAKHAAGVLEPGVQVASRYRVKKFLGRGGMGEVWLADEMDSDVFVQEAVIKVVPPEMQKDRDILENIKSSFGLVRKLRHPNICSALTFAVDETFGALCVMDYVPGADLETLQKRQENKVFTLEQAIVILTPLASALDYAHKKKTLHRDIKPQNIMIPLVEGKPQWDEPKLIDFDLAVEWHSTRSIDVNAEYRVSGTLPYMAPEQIDGEAPDARTDQYSLAAVVYQMLTGKLPFKATVASVLINQILNKPHESIENVPDYVNEAVGKALSKKKENRFDSCADFVAALSSPRALHPGSPLLDTMDNLKGLMADETQISQKRLRPEGFDPYYEWLGISPYLPLTYYRLLGVPQYESNLNVISNAADRQMAFVRTYQQGKHSAESQKILNEIAQARVCLLNAQNKAEYDIRLRNQLNQIGEVQPMRAPMIPDTVSVSPASPPMPEKKAETPVVQSAVAAEQAPAINKVLPPAAPAEKAGFDFGSLTAKTPQSPNARDDKKAERSAIGKRAGRSSIGKKSVPIPNAISEKAPTSAEQKTHNRAKKAAGKTANIPLYAGIGVGVLILLICLSVFLFSGGKNKTVINNIEKTPQNEPILPDVSGKNQADANEASGAVESEASPEVETSFAQKTPEEIEAEEKAREEQNRAVQLEIWQTALSQAENDNKAGRKIYDEKLENAEIQTGEWKPGIIPGERQIRLFNGVKFPFRWIPAGTFSMGSPGSEPGRNSGETVHVVTLTKGFWMLETEVTQAMYQAVTGSNPSVNKGNNYPVENVNHLDARSFCEKLFQQWGVQAKLPTESQWEYACRAGSSEAFFDFNPQNVGWFFMDTNDKPFLCGTKKPNAWGLYDMHGNVSEWCADAWNPDWGAKPLTDPLGNDGGTYVKRGGGWVNHPNDCRAARRVNAIVFVKNKYSGFRFIVQ